MKTIKRWVALTIAIAMLYGTAAQAQVMQQVSSDALVVLKVNNLKGFSDKFGKLAQDLGLVGFVPQLGDPLGGAQGMMQIQQGLNSAGELAVEFFDPATVGGDPEKAVVIFVPVSDYKAFLSNSAQVNTEGDISQVTFGQPMFAANWGQYAVLSQNKDLLSRKPTTPLAAPSVSAKELASKDIILYANFSALRVKAIPGLQQAKAAVSSEIEQGLGAAPMGPKFMPVIKVLINHMFNIAEGFLNEAQAATVGLAVMPDGLAFSSVAEFKPGGYATQNITSIKNSSAPLLGGLPAGKYLMYGGVATDPQKNLKIVSDLIDPIVKELMNIGPEMTPVTDYVSAVKEQIGASTGQSFGMLAPTGALGAESVFQMVSIQRGDAKTMAAAAAKAVDAETRLMKGMNLPNISGMVPSYTPKAKTVDGVVFDAITNSMDPNVQDPVARQQQEIMKMMYGPQGLVINLGIVSDKMLMAMGVSDEVIHNAITTMNSNAAPLENDEALKEVTAQLPKERIGVLYINVAEIATTGLNYAKQFGFPIPVQFPPGLPPIGAAVSTQDGTAIRVDVYVPKSLVQSMIAAGMQAAMQMGGGGGGPRGGGL